MTDSLNPASGPLAAPPKPLPYDPLTGEKTAEDQTTTRPEQTDADRAAQRAHDKAVHDRTVEKVAAAMALSHFDPRRPDPVTGMFASPLAIVDPTGYLQDARSFVAAAEAFNEARHEATMEVEAERKAEEAIAAQEAEAAAAARSESDLDRKAETLADGDPVQMPA